MVVCADGGCNWLFDAFNFDYERIKYKPHAIVGDLDSIRPEVRVFYEKIGSAIVRNRDQDNTDFEKSILYVLEEQKRINSKNKADFFFSHGSYGNDNKLVAYGAFGGRID